MNLVLIRPGSFFRPAIYATGEEMTIQGFCVPVGFVTDGATIPPALWPFVPPWGRYARAALLHDYVLSIGMKWEDAAKLFYRQMLEDGVGEVRSKILYRAVRVYGWLKI